MTDCTGQLEDDSCVALERESLYAFSWLQKLSASLISVTSKS